MTNVTEGASLKPSVINQIADMPKEELPQYLGTLQLDGRSVIVIEENAGQQEIIPANDNGQLDDNFFHAAREVTEKSHPQHHGIVGHAPRSRKLHERTWFRFYSVVRNEMTRHIVVVGNESDERLLMMDHIFQTERALKETQEKLKQAETTNERLARDELTGLYRRQQGGASIKDVLELAHHESGKPDVEKQVALAMLDIDHFKDVNDTFGHPVGDAVLKHISGLIASSMRSTDTAIRYGDEKTAGETRSMTAIRYGGEEILLAAMVDDESEAEKFAERIRAAIENTPFILTKAEDIAKNGSGNELRITASLGVAVVNPNAFAISDANVNLCDSENAIGQALQKADAALYRAKNSGRNRVRIHTSRLVHSNDLMPATLGSEDVYEVVYSRNFVTEDTFPQNHAYDPDQFTARRSLGLYGAAALQPYVSALKTDDLSVIAINHTPSNRAKSDPLSGIFMLARRVESVPAGAKVHSNPEDLTGNLQEAMQSVRAEIDQHLRQAPKAKLQI